MIDNPGDRVMDVRVESHAYRGHETPVDLRIPPQGRTDLVWSVVESGGWYDFSVRCPALQGYLRRAAGRLETGRPSISDPAMGGPAILDQV
jgi:phospholipase C